MRTLLAVTLAGVLALSACGSEGDDSTISDKSGASGGPSPSALPVDSNDPTQNLENARAMWDQGGLTDYAWTYERICYCPSMNYRITVEDGVATDRKRLAPDGMAAQKADLATMEDLFERVQKSLTEADDVQATYDPQTGAVKKVVIDQIKGAVDDEMTYVVKNVQPTD